MDVRREREFDFLNDDDFERIFAQNEFLFILPSVLMSGGWLLNSYIYINIVWTYEEREFDFENIRANVVSLGMRQMIQKKNIRQST